MDELLFAFSFSVGGRCACGGTVEWKENQHLSQIDLYVSTNATVI